MLVLLPTADTLTIQHQNRHTRNLGLFGTKLHSTSDSLKQQNNKMEDVNENSYIKIEKAFWMNQSQLIGALVALIAVLITLIIFAIWQKRKNARRGVLLMGLCDSGKTLIFSRLLHNRFVATHTSVKENAGDYLMNNDFLRVTDIPGHERLRGKFFEQYKSTTRGVIFVIDSVTIQKEIRDVAELLYMLLTNSTIVSKGIHILIACNKQDQTMAKGSSVIKLLLEKELNLLRTTKTKQLNSIEGITNNNNYLGVVSKDFKFTHIPLVVEFTESAALKKDADVPADLDGIRDWLNSIA